MNKSLPVCLCVMCLMWQGCNPSQENVANGAQPAKETAAANIPESISIESSSVNNDSESELPICEIDQIKSCDITSDGADETIYHCPHCATGIPASDCKQHACTDCCEKNCRCRLRKSNNN